MRVKDTGIKRIIKALGYSCDGFKATFESEQSFRQDLVFFAVSVCLALVLDFSIFMKALIFFASFLILFAELINTAIETIIDRISPEYHDLSKKAKDIGSSMILVAFVNVFFIWMFALINLRQ